MARRTRAASEATEPKFEPRRGQSDMTVGYTAADGSQKSIEADADGVFWPKSTEEEAVLRDSFGLPVARKAENELKAAAAAADEAPTAAPNEPKE